MPTAPPSSRRSTSRCARRNCRSPPAWSSTSSRNGGALRVDRELLAASLLDGASVSVGVSQSAAFDVPSLLMTLDRYPYGCAEQTTSRALPLLYVNELASGVGMAERSGPA